ncbi:MAG: PDZ domain-containing protein [Verrucomicrobiae bacterium]|nr:PDZ domain-containing protein [Verrucomicrobiae bacterium]
MKRRLRFVFPAACLAAIFASSGRAETVKDREGAVRNDRASHESGSVWVYNDVEKGFAQAKSTGKPLLVVLRCVPCLACAGIDGQVLMENSALSPLLNQFVPVRLINANAIDLTRFQFDYDLSFSTLFFNADGTLYGRYGSWTHQKNPEDTDTASFRRALERVLALHRGYPANRGQLAGKQGAPSPFKTPVEIPSLAEKYTRDLDWEGPVVKSCVHCHMIGDAHRALYREKGEPIPMEWLYPHPSPETIGLTLSPEHAARVDAVAPDSIAAKAGFLSGDDIEIFGGQPLVSLADFGWVLHRAPDAGRLEASVRRGSDLKPIAIELPAEWRFAAAEPRRVATWGLRGMATGGLRLLDLTDEERAARGFGNSEMALRIDFVGQYNKHAAAKKAGFKMDDIIVLVDGMSGRMSEGELMGRLIRAHRAGETVKVSLRRGDREMELTLPMQ